MLKIRDSKRKLFCYGNINNDYLDHPLIFLDIDEKKTLACPYCQKIFINQDFKENSRNGNLIND
ncbi:zinc-finger domain-containing protein [Wolbachia endosymbiont of Howardula sp.]|uniref:zinc-finger domain-containing protein n=1 Tax=Wolbachia endosymbiont of Howardula sp. TaxID=2916816 RepID=UPI00217F143A|nr:zinc-finger domain-containing protein [Wolbachia endosymbiont of Howardula sp.]UWI83100.1 zinc-finger domain-containing protein [Wolbachia endosymbiont of Howardula sp.]